MMCLVSEMVHHCQLFNSFYLSDVFIILDFDNYGRRMDVCNNIISVRIIFVLVLKTNC